MEIKVKLFGQLADIAGKSEFTGSEITSTRQLEDFIRSEFPLIGNKKFILAVNKKIIQNEQNLAMGDEVAVMPPFAGG